MATAKRNLTNPSVQGQPQGPRAGHGAGPLPRLLTVKEVASVLRVTPEYVTRWLIFTKRIPYVKVGRRPLVDQRDLLDFMARRRVTATTPEADGIRRRRRSS